MSSATTKPTTSKSRRLAVEADFSAQTQDQQIARLLADGIATNAVTVTRFAKGEHGEVDLTEVFNAVKADGRSVQRGDLSGIESVLTAQIAALNTIFGEMARRAALNMGEYLDAADRYMRLALRAQSQCRATAETLAVIKAGPPIFARQANVAHGPQQVNNGIPHASRVDPRACERTASDQPELLESSDGERLDAGTAGAAVGGYPTVEAVGAEHRPEDPRGEGTLAAER